MQDSITLTEQIWLAEQVNLPTEPKKFSPVACYWLPLGSNVFLSTPFEHPQPTSTFMWETKFYTHKRTLFQLPLYMYRRMIRITRDAMLRVAQPPFVVSSLVGGISFKIFQIPKLEEVIANRALRRAEGRGQRALQWLGAFNSERYTRHRPAGDQQHVSHN
jgi:hypothetical protein